MKNLKFILVLWALILGALAPLHVPAQTPPALTRGAADLRYLRSVSTPLDTVLRALGLGDILPYEESGVPLGVLENTGGSAQTGWGSPVGPRGTFNAIAVGISNMDSTAPVTGVRVFVTENTPGGASLADVRQPIYIAPGAAAEVIVRMPRAITNASPLYVRHNTNGKTGVYRVNPLTTWNTPTYAGYGTTNNTNLDSTAFTQPGGSQNCAYYRFLNLPFDRSSASGDLVTTAEAHSVSATFTGYGSYAGSPTHAFNSVDLGLSWFRADTRATSFRVVVRRTNSAGAILAESTVRNVDWAGVPAFRPLLVRFDLGRDVDPGPVWLEVLGDGTFSFAKLTNGTYSTSLGTTRYATNSSLRSPNWSNSGAQWNLWARFTKWYTSDAGTGVGEAELRTSVARAILLATAPRVNLPAQIYATTSKEFSLYFDQVIVPVVGQRAEDKYDFDVTCSVGMQQAERFLIRSGDAAAAGTYALTIDVWDRGQLVATGSTSLIIKGTTAGAGQTRKIVFAGDSLTEQGNILAELKRLFAADGSLAATFIGSKSVTEEDSTGASQTIAHEGYSGKTAQFLATDNTPSTGSAFVLAGSGTFNYSAYLTARSATQSSGDYFAIFTGTNECFGASTDAAVRTAFWTYKQSVDTMVASARSAVSGIRIVLITPPGPSGSQDSFSISYTNGQTRWRYKRNAALFSELVKEWYDTAANRTANLFVCMPGHGWDTVNNARRASSAAANEYSSVNLTRMNDGVHPGGYNEGGGAFQIASRIYQFVKGQES